MTRGVLTACGWGVQACGKNHDGSFGSGRFCNAKCAVMPIAAKVASKRKQKGYVVVSESDDDDDVSHTMLAHAWLVVYSCWTRSSRHIMNGS